MSDKPYSVVGLGGTFDHFHIGHQSFLQFSASLADKIIVAVTDDELAKTKAYPQQLQLHADRYQRVKNFCETHNINADVIPLHDVYGPTLNNSPVEAVAVTTATISGAEQINTERSRLGLTPLPVHIHSLINDETGEPINSTRIRAGNINREGIVYAQILKDDLVLSEEQRHFFTHPQGEFVTTPSQGFFNCVVGDASLELFVSKNWFYDLGVFDAKGARKPYTSPWLEKITPDKTVVNHNGMISQTMTRTLQEWLDKPFKHLFIEGEEDLATVALVLLLPLGCHVYYGQPEKGMIEITITEAKKQEFYSALHSQ